MQREAYFDNAKLLFIFLVVFGHLIQPLKESIELVNVLYQWIYIFHMPVFILISGFFAKGASNKGYLIKLFKRILVPYFIFQILYTIYFLGIGKNDWDTSLYDPQWGLWFLLSLFSWHLLLIVFKKIPPMIGIPLAFLIGIMIGYLPVIGEAFSLSRTFVFFPFFLIGYWLTKERLFAWKNRKNQIVSVAIIFVVFLVSYLQPKIPTGWLFGSHSYLDLELPFYGGAARFGLYLLAIFMVFSVLLLVPKQRYSFTNLGQNTMYVYLLHGIIIQYGREAGLLQLDHNLDTIGLAVIAAAIVWFLSSKSVATFTQPIVEGKTTLLAKWFENRENKWKKREQRDAYPAYKEKSS